MKILHRKTAGFRVRPTGEPNRYMLTGNGLRKNECIGLDTNSGLAKEVMSSLPTTGLTISSDRKLSPPAFIAITQVVGRESLHAAFEDPDCRVGSYATVNMKEKDIIRHECVTAARIILNQNI